MIRADIIATIGRNYLITNIENDEFSYPKAFTAAGLEFPAIRNRQGRTFEVLDIRFVKDNVSILVETKTNFTQRDEAQLAAYVRYEKELTNNKIIAILANTENDRIKVWRGVVSDNDYLAEETVLRGIDEYVDFYTYKVNDKEKVMRNTVALNELLHMYGITTENRCQFVGTCLLALKKNMDYRSPTLNTAQILAGIQEVLGNLLTNNVPRADKIVTLVRRVLQSPNIQGLRVEHFRKILAHIEENILPYINDRTKSGQDLLNLFFVTFNKYARRTDKNQAFTPDHITDFMAKITGVNRRSVVLDPCCGSGSFLVRAMTQALDDCRTKQDQEKVKKKQIYGIEYEENIYGLAATNMLIHSDGNSNIMQGNCFMLKSFIQESKPNVILMNPPYNALRNHLPDEYTNTWSSSTVEDPSKGLYFVKYIMDTLNESRISATLAVLLPVSCAIGSSNEIARLKKEILEENTLDAVFTLPNEVFYPGASASVCCMVFKVGKSHLDVSNPDTFFGYCKDDGFKKKKNLGRVEQVDDNTGKSRWEEIENEWLELYRRRQSVAGKSAVKKVTGNDEWLCEAYMKTDYSTLLENNFERTIIDYYSHLIKIGCGLDD